jgi:tRNA threonylcarbamoyladenosine biosynthesis protein TsaE
MPVNIPSPEAMCDYGRAFAATAADGDVIALVGNLGAGKTHWTKGFVVGLGSDSTVTSPTFGLVHEYPGGRLPVFHFDFHRIDTADELLAIGWDDYLDRPGVIIAEWADKFPELLPPHTRWITIQALPDGTRRLLM